MSKRLKPWILIKNTRFRTEGQIIFRINEKIEVPGSTYAMIRDENGKLTREKVPGVILIDVIADEMDAGEKIVGDRGNITKGSSLILPALDPTSQKILYAEAYEGDEEFFYFWRSIESYRRTLPKFAKTLTTDMDYFKYLYSSTGN